MNSEFPYRVFFAIPFDPAMRAMYNSIIDKLKTDPEYRDRLQFEFGTKVVGPSQEFANMQAFKEQNASLLEQFFSQIGSSDIVVADLTNNNPNVHVELGIALSQYKNILRVSGRNIVEVGSDIKGHYVDHYPDAETLVTKLKDYLQMFLKIKKLPLSAAAGSLYRSHSPVTIENRTNFHHAEHLLNMRDGELKIKFQFSWTYDDLSWFGAFIRSTQPWIGGYLIYVRKNGSLEIDQMQGSKLPPKQYSPLAQNQEYTFHFKIDGSHLIASLDDEFFDYLQLDDLKNQSFGSVFVASFGSEVKLLSIETVCRDTIDFS